MVPSYLRRAQPPLGSGMRQGCSCWCLGYMRGSAVDTEVNGSWERKDAWMTLCWSTHTGMSSGILWARGVLQSPKWAGGKASLSSKVNRGRRDSKELLWSSLEVHVRWRWYWREKKGLHTHTNGIEILDGKERPDFRKLLYVQKNLPCNHQYPSVSVTWKLSLFLFLLSPDSLTCFTCQA